MLSKALVKFPKFLNHGSIGYETTNNLYFGYLTKYKQSSFHGRETKEEKNSHFNSSIKYEDFENKDVPTEKNDCSLSKYEHLFKNIGLNPNTIKNTLANPRLSGSLARIIEKTKLNRCEKKTGVLLYDIATKLGSAFEEKQDFLTKYVIDEKIKTPQQLEKAIKYIQDWTRRKQSTKFSLEELERCCGIGKEISDEDVRSHIKSYLLNVQQSDIKKLNTTSALKELRTALPQADQRIIFKIFNEEISAIKQREESIEFCSRELSKKQEKIFKVFARDLTSSFNPPEILEKHLNDVGSQIRTRFPPEPNGYLHLGHAKAIRFNFTSAFDNGGTCHLRFDDTNPEKESKEYIDSIIRNVEWLGYNPASVFYSSDRFEQIYEFAIKLIEDGKAYVCEQSKEEMNRYRKEGLASPYRDRPCEENLKLFEEMQAGKYDEGRYCLRLKISPDHENPTMRDPVAFRIKHVAHPHTGTKWCIYPTYDFTHCICDSLENITHSLCSLEFEIRRDLYYWILENLNIYRPKVWEYSRLNISYNVMSKRKILKLVEKGVVNGWDDPRLLTLDGLRRRGYTKEAINEFLDAVSVSRNGNENIVELDLLEHAIRKNLNELAPRTMVVTEPVRVVIENLPENFEQAIEVQEFKNKTEKGNTFQVKLTREIFVERSDIMLNDHPDFFGIAPFKEVMLRYAFPIRCKEVLSDSEGNPVEVRAEMFPKEELINSNKKLKGILHWISARHALDCELRLYDRLFTAREPGEAEDITEVVNPQSLRVLKQAKINPYIFDSIKPEDKFQFERVGYFCLDKDSDILNKKLVFNRTVTLKDKEKSKALKQA